MGYLKSNVILIIIMIILLLSSIFFFINCSSSVEPGQPGTKGPEINVKYGLDDTACNGICDLGGMVKGTTKDVDFEIENLGTEDLNLAVNVEDRVVISGQDESMFTVTVQPSSTIPPGGIDTFTIQAAPTISGNIETNVSIQNDDSDESPYIFTIKLNVTSEPEPEIHVKLGAANVYPGVSYYLQSQEINTSKLVGFTIQNLGTADLNLAVNVEDRVVISGEHASMFTVTVQPSSTIPPTPPDNSEDFIIQFTPTELGRKTAEVTILNNDSDENPYNFTIAATGTPPPVGGHVTLPDSLIGPATCIIAMDTEYNYSPEYSVIINVEDGATVDGFDYEDLDVTDGDYYIWAYIDVNENSIIGDPGDYLGTFGDIDPNIDSPNAQVDQDNRDFDFYMSVVESPTPLSDDEGDVDKDFIDITAASITVNWSVIYCEVTVKSIPATLLFDNEDLPQPRLEYGWYVIFDVNNNGVGVGDYDLLIHNARLPGETERVVDRADILVNTWEDVFKRTSETQSTILCSIQASLVDDRVFVLYVDKLAHVELKNITTAATIYVQTYYDDAETLYKDYLP